MRPCLAGILGGIMIAAPSLEGQIPVVSGPPQIATTGVGEASAVPDRATIYIAVQTRAPTASAASADNARRVKAVMDSLRLTGIGADQVQTANYNVSPEMAYPTTPSQAPRTVAYTVTNSLLLKLKRIDDVARAIDAALAKGANEISSLQFSSSTADSVRSVALAAAVADAKLQAEAMARAAGGSLGQLLELSTSIPVRPMPMVQSFSARAGVQTPITPGEQSISATVSARWAFVPGR
jgi:uncharacterized protein YggE